MSGTAVLMNCSVLVGEHDVHAAFQAARDDEYEEIADKCQDFLAQLEKEYVANHFTFAELEENEEDLIKLRNWFAKIVDRDVFGAPGRAATAEALQTCEAALEKYAARFTSRKPKAGNLGAVERGPQVPTDRRGYGRLADEVWQVLVAAEHPLTPAQVRAALDGDLAYTTVMTVLGRLVEKGIATRERAGRAYAYTAVADQAELTARRMHRLLDARDDRARVLARFVNELSADDEKLLGDLLGPDDDDRRGPRLPGRHCDFRCCGANSRTSTATGRRRTTTGLRQRADRWIIRFRARRDGLPRAGTIQRGRGMGRLVAHGRTRRHRPPTDRQRRLWRRRRPGGPRGALSSSRSNEAAHCSRCAAAVPVSARRAASRSWRATPRMPSPRPKWPAGS